MIVTLCMIKIKPQILEINPRPSGSVVVSICAGVPLIKDLIFLTKDIK